MPDQDNTQSAEDVSPVPCKEVYIVEFIPVELIPMEIPDGSETFDVFQHPKWFFLHYISPLL